LIKNQKVIDDAKTFWSVSASDLVSKNRIKFEHIDTTVSNTGGQAIDLFILNKVLYQKGEDSQVLDLLKALKNEIKGSTKLVLVEPVFGLGGWGEQVASYMDMAMLVIGDGRVRTADEVVSLLKESGWNTVNVIQTRSPLTIIEAS